MKVPYGRQSIQQDDIDSVVEVLKSDFLTQGPAVEVFENSLTSLLGGTKTLAVSNGTTALHLAASALGVQPGDRVLVTSNSFVASANCIRYCGGDVDFVDINPHDFCLSLEHLKNCLAGKPAGYYKGIVAVDFAGYPINFERLRKIADEYDLWIIEDACHAVGASFTDSKGIVQMSGNCEYADVAVFSFHPVKHIATGEGGAVATKSEELFKKMKLLRTHGITRDPSEMLGVDGGWYYEMKELGFNYRISDILCALGASQMRRIEKNIFRRNQIADTYRKELVDLPISLPKNPDNGTHAYHLFVIQTDRRFEAYEFLKEKSIFCQVHYIPIYRHPYYRKIYGEQSFGNMDTYYSKALSLPMYHGMSDDEQEYVIKCLTEFYAKF